MAGCPSKPQASASIRSRGVAGFSDPEAWLVKLLLMSPESGFSVAGHLVIKSRYMRNYAKWVH